MIIDIHNHADYHRHSIEKSYWKYGIDIDITCLLSWECPEVEFDPAIKHNFSPFLKMPVPFERCAEYKQKAPNIFLLGFCPDPREPDAIERLKAVTDLYDISRWNVKFTKVTHVKFLAVAIRF